MHDLKYRAHPANGVVDGHRADELCGQVGVESLLHLQKIQARKKTDSIGSIVRVESSFF